MPQTHLTDTRFDQFDLHPQILAGLKDAGFEFCTPIQAETLPIALAGHDVAGQAQTGTGKTAAFLLVALQRLLQSEQREVSPAAAAVDERSSVTQGQASVAEQSADGGEGFSGAAEASAGLPSAEAPSLAGADTEQADRSGRARRSRQPRVLILAPTRELAVQIHKDAELLAAHTDFKLAVVYGGTGYQSQRDALAAGVDILIGTPGRLIDYFKQRVFDLRDIDVVILDEADRMFDLGFIKDIRFILRRLPSPTHRLGMLFSATLSYRVMELAYEHMNDPKMVEIMPEQVTADRVTQQAYMVANEEKVPLLIGLLRSFEDARSMVFVNTKREGERVWGYLEGNGLPAAMLSGDVPQKKRLSLLKRFQRGELVTMVATDVAARGLHIPGVTHVINYDLPDDPEDYVHRIGRTARAGAAGDAISFVCETYAMGWPDIEAFVGATIPMTTPDAALLAEVDSRSRVRVERRPRAGGAGGSGRPVRSRAGSGPRERRSDRRKGSPDGAMGQASNATDRASHRAERGPQPPDSDGAGQAVAVSGASESKKAPKRRRRRSRARPGDSQAPAPQT